MPNHWDWNRRWHYDHENWRCHIIGMEQEPERGARCLRCFKLRLVETARYAHEHGFSVITHDTWLQSLEKPGADQ